MAWYLCSISRSAKGNWDLCKQASLWGVPGPLGRDRDVVEGDHLLFWVGQRGYVGFGNVSGYPRAPRSREEAPWPGGKYRFTTVIPFRLVVEAKEPYRLAFVNGVQQVTGFSSAKFQHSLAPISDDAAEKVTAELVTRALAS